MTLDPISSRLSNVGRVAEPSKADVPQAPHDGDRLCTHCAFISVFYIAEQLDANFDVPQAPSVTLDPAL